MTGDPTDQEPRRRKQVDGTEFLSVRQLAQRWGVTEPTIWRWQKDGKIPPPTNIGPQVTRFSLKAIEQYESENTGKNREEDAS